MNILDLLKKYESNDSIEYLKKILGDEEYIIDVFKSTMAIKHIIERNYGNYRLFSIFHNIYINIKNDSIIDDTLMNCLVIMDSYFKPLNNQLSYADKRRSKAIKLSSESVKQRQDMITKKMYTIDNIPVNYDYIDIVKEINKDKEEFSLDEQFNYETGYNYQEDLNAVTVITPTQTVSRFNDNSINGLKGSGHHDANFVQIHEAIYGRLFINNQNEQDIMIRYMTSINDDKTLRFIMTVSMPFIINSTQYQSLSSLNQEIKLLEKKLEQNIEVHVAIIDYESRNYVKFIENKTNFDETLNEIVVDDMKENKYQELCFVGYSNLENHYNKVHYVK